MTTERSEDDDGEAWGSRGRGARMMAERLEDDGELGGRGKRPPRMTEGAKIPTQG
jgi:hypothetical protein